MMFTPEAVELLENIKAINSLVLGVVAAVFMFKEDYPKAAALFAAAAWCGVGL